MIGASLLKDLVAAASSWIMLQIDLLKRKSKQKKAGEALENEVKNSNEPRDPEEIKREEDAFNS